MDPIQEAITEINSRAPGASFSYTKFAAKYGVERSTLARRHQGKHQPHAIAHQKLNPQRELELVQYIQTLTERRTLPSC